MNNLMKNTHRVVREMRENPQWRPKSKSQSNPTRAEPHISLSLAAPYFSLASCGRPTDPPVHAIITKSALTIYQPGQISRSCGRAQSGAPKTRDAAPSRRSLWQVYNLWVLAWSESETQNKNLFSALSLQVSIVLCRKVEERVMTGIIHASSKRVACVCAL